ncbi:MAG: DUF6387 family protein [Candidatus Nitrotoga sp.]|nr:DUF6387 family protein [Candidatus Nitrotoga sp.]
MKKVNKNSNLIPEWFDLKKYEIGKNHALLDWTMNLNIRRGILLHTSPHWGNDQHTEISKNEFELIKKHGFLDRTLMEDELWNLKYCYLNEDKNNKPGYGLVYSLPLEEAVNIYKTIKSDTKLRNQLASVEYHDVLNFESAEFWHRGKAKLLTWHEDNYRKTSFDDIHGDGIIENVCIDMGAPDETIIEAFKDWLKDTRENKESLIAKEEIPEKKISNNLISKWISSSILPYLDLKIYQQIEGVNLRTHEIGNAIFPSSVTFDTTEAVRKTTRINADKVLLQLLAIMRHALIAEELQKNGKKNG